MRTFVIVNQGIIETKKHSWILRNKEPPGVHNSYLSYINVCYSSALRDFKINSPRKSLWNTQKS